MRGRTGTSLPLQVRLASFEDGVDLNMATFWSGDIGPKVSIATRSPKLVLTVEAAHWKEF